MFGRRDKTFEMPRRRLRPTRRDLLLLAAGASAAGAAGVTLTSAIAGNLDSHTTGHQTPNGNYLITDSSGHWGIGQELTSPGYRVVRVDSSAQGYGSYINYGISAWQGATGATVFQRNDQAGSYDVLIEASSYCEPSPGFGAWETDLSLTYCGNVIDSDYTLRDSMLLFDTARFDPLTDDTKRAGLTHELGHTLGFNDHYYYAQQPTCRSDVSSIMEDWGCSGTTPTGHDNTDFQWAYRPTVTVDPVYVHPNATTPHIHWNGPYINNESGFGIAQSAYVGGSESTVSTPPKNQGCSGEGGTSCYAVDLPGNGTQLCQRVYWGTNAYPGLAGISPFSKYACTARRSGSSPTSYKWYATSDRNGDVYLRMYNTGTHKLYDAKICWTDGSAIPNSDCCTASNISVGGVKSCHFANTGSGAVRTYARPGSSTADFVSVDVGFGP